MARILVIDDDQDILAIILDVLRHAGHEAVTAIDGVQGLDIQRNDPAQIVITDLLMPEKEGIETIRELKREFPTLGIIAMSGGGKTIKGLNYLSIAQEIGADRILLKPFDSAALLDAVRDLLSLPAA